MTKVKVCGITNIDDALLAVSNGADSIGFNFNKGSKRYIGAEEASEIIQKLPPHIKSVGLFTNDDVTYIYNTANLSDIDIIQIHEKNFIDFCSDYWGPVVKAIRVEKSNTLKTMVDYHINYNLFTGKQKTMPSKDELFLDLKLTHEFSKYGMVILSGGLTLSNVKEAIWKVRPYCVDLDSEVEKETGKKDGSKLKQFIEIIKSS